MAKSRSLGSGPVVAASSVLLFCAGFVACSSSSGDASGGAGGDAAAGSGVAGGGEDGTQAGGAGAGAAGAGGSAGSQAGGQPDLGQASAGGAPNGQGGSNEGGGAGDACDPACTAQLGTNNCPAGQAYWHCGPIHSFSGSPEPCTLIPTPQPTYCCPASYLAECY